MQKLRLSIVNMKTGTAILLGGIALIALVHFGNLGVAANVLQYYIMSVDFTGISTGKIILMVQNPSNATITLNSMAGTISANGSVIGNISNFQGGVEIPANNQTPVTINVALSLTAIVGQLYDILVTPNGANQVAFVITGNANVDGGIIVPFSVTQNVMV